jgi:DNA polymerase III alpha subunit (gram-positive type)
MTDSNIRIIWWDLETDGLNPYHNNIIEISAIDNFGNKYDTLVNNEIDIDQNITKITGITRDMINKNGKNVDIVVKEFYQYLTSNKFRQIFMCAHNGDGFDRLFLKTLFNRYGLKFTKNLYFLDTLYLSRLVLCHMKSHSLDSLCKYYKIVNKNAHRAMSDVDSLINLWENVWIPKFREIYKVDNIVEVYRRIYF